MPRTIRPRNSRSPSSPAGSRAGEGGYVLVVVLFMAALILVALTVSLPNVYTQGRREREEELVFRGMQYARAVALFHRQFNRYPTDVKELLQTNRIRFLRQEYKDPMTRKGQWRFIHANAAGVLLDSKLRPLPQSGQPGSSGGMFGSGSSQGSMFGSGSSQGSMFGRGSSQGNMLGGMSSQGSTFGSPGGALQGPPGEAPSNPSSESASSTGRQGSSASMFGQGEVKGAFIVGVASTSKKGSIRVWNKRTHYDEWEFLGVDMSMLGLGGTIPGLTPGVGMPGGQGQPGLPGMQPGGPMGPGMPGRGFGSGGFGGPEPLPPQSNPGSAPQ